MALRPQTATSIQVFYQSNVGAKSKSPNSKAYKRSKKVRRERTRPEQVAHLIQQSNEMAHLRLTSPDLQKRFIRSGSSGINSSTGQIQSTNNSSNFRGAFKHKSGAVAKPHEYSGDLPMTSKILHQNQQQQRTP